MPIAKRLPSGNYRCRVYDTTVDGKKKYISFTAKTKKEAELKATIHMNTSIINAGNDFTVKEMLNSYWRLREKALSASTIRDYKRFAESDTYGSILYKKAKKIMSSDLQEWVSSYSVDHNPKTVKNAYSFILSSLKFYFPDRTYNVKLPQKIVNETYVPTDEEVKTLISYFKERKDSDMEIATCLGAFCTMRRSEICGLDAKDIKDGKAHIHKSIVKDKDGFYVEKGTKTTESTRIVDVPKFVLDLLPKRGKIVSISPTVITTRFIRAQNKLCFDNRFRFHDLRHYSASIMHALGVPDQYIMKVGGWKTDGVLKSIYRGTMNDYEKKFRDVTLKHFDEFKI